MNGVSSEEMERKELVSALKDKLYCEIREERQFLVREMNLFCIRHAEEFAASGVMADDTYDYYRSLVDHAHDLEALEDYVDREDAFLECRPGSYELVPDGDNRYSIARGKDYYLPKAKLHVWLQEDYRFTSVFLSFCADLRREGQVPIMCRELFNSDDFTGVMDILLYEHMQAQNEEEKER